MAAQTPCDREAYHEGTESNPESPDATQTHRLNPKRHLVAMRGHSCRCRQLSDWAASQRMLTGRFRCATTAAADDSAEMPPTAAPCSCLCPGWPSCHQSCREISVSALSSRVRSGSSERHLCQRQRNLLTEGPRRGEDAASFATWLHGASTPPRYPIEAICTPPGYPVRSRVRTSGN